MIVMNPRNDVPLRLMLENGNMNANANIVSEAVVYAPETKLLTNPHVTYATGANLKDGAILASTMNRTNGRWDLGVTRYAGTFDTYLNLKCLCAGKYSKIGKCYTSGWFYIDKSNRLWRLRANNETLGWQNEQVAQLTGPANTAINAIASETDKFIAVAWKGSNSIYIDIYDQQTFALLHRTANLFTSGWPSAWSSAVTANYYVQGAMAFSICGGFLYYSMMNNATNQLCYAMSLMVNLDGSLSYMWTRSQGITVNGNANGWQNAGCMIAIQPYVRSDYDDKGFFVQICNPTFTRYAMVRFYTITNNNFLSDVGYIVSGGGCSAKPSLQYTDFTAVNQYTIKSYVTSNGVGSSPLNTGISPNSSLLEIDWAGLAPAYTAPFPAIFAYPVNRRDQNTAQTLILGIDNNTGIVRQFNPIGRAITDRGTCTNLNLLANIYTVNRELSAVYFPRSSMSVPFEEREGQIILHSLGFNSNEVVHFRAFSQENNANIMLFDRDNERAIAMASNDHSGTIP